MYEHVIHDNIYLSVIPEANTCGLICDGFYILELTCGFKDEVREARKNSFLVARPLKGGGGGKGLVTMK